MEYKITNTRTLWSQLKASVTYKELFFALAWRNIKIQYSKSYLGFLWVVLQPLIMTSIFYLALNAQLGSTTPNYFIFLFSGFALWNLFASSLMASSGSLLVYSYMIKKVYFPRFLLPLTFVVSSCFDFMIVYVVLLIGLHFTEIPINYGMFFVSSFMAIGIMLLVTIGLSLTLSAWIIYFRDIQHILPFIIQVLLFTSPVIYDSSIVFQQPYISTILTFNPVGGALELFRAGIFSEAIEWASVLKSLAIALFIFVAGIGLFHRADRELADYL